MNDLNNKIIWITGASSGIGKELAIQLAQEGARIILSARSEDKLQALKSELQGEEHWVFPMDLMKVDEVPDKVQEVLQKVGSIDVLINNAGISQRSKAIDTSIEVDRKIMELDHFSKVAMTKALLPSFIAQQGGMYVTISSVAGKIGVPMRTAYCAAKHAIIGFMDAIRAENAQYGIEVLNVTPGFVKTNISVNAMVGDGSTHGVMDPLIADGMPVDKCVRKIVKGMKKGTKELLIAEGKSGLAPLLKRIYPNALFRMMEKVAVQ